MRLVLHMLQPFIVADGGETDGSHVVLVVMPRDFVGYRSWSQEVRGASPYVQ